METQALEKRGVIEVRPFKNASMRLGIRGIRKSTLYTVRGFELLPLSTVLESR